jgi:hypothetical protein
VTPFAPCLGGRCLDLTVSCGPAQFRGALTALGSGGAGASLTELRLRSSLCGPQALVLEGVAMLPGSLPQLRSLHLSAYSLVFSSGESVRSLLMAPGGRLERLELSVRGMAGPTLETIADEVSRCVRPSGGHRLLWRVIVWRVPSCRVTGSAAGVAGVAQAADTDG